ncbi:MAG: hypothetical protein AAB263_03635, partial [Planctomycetota bacterium]
ATIDLIAEKLGVPMDDIRAAAQRSREQPAATIVTPTLPEPGRPMPTLARLAAERIAASGQSAAALAHAHGIPYLALSALLSSGNPPTRPEVLDPLRKALGLDESGFAASLEQTIAAPEPAQPSDILPAVNPFHGALLEMARKNGWNQTAFAKASGVTALTAAKLMRRGELPGRRTTHAKLRQLLELDEAAYADLIARSSPAQAAFAEPETDRVTAHAMPESAPKHQLHAALVGLVRDRGLTQQAFAQAADLSVLTAARLLKGDLPGREKTHLKLRQMLGLSEVAYAEMVDQSNAGVATALIPRVREPVDPEVQRLVDAIRALNEERRGVVWKLVRELSRT